MKEVGKKREAEVCRFGGLSCCSSLMRDKSGSFRGHFEYSALGETDFSNLHTKSIDARSKLDITKWKTRGAAIDLKGC